MFTTEAGSAWVIWRMSPPAVMTASRNDMVTIASGLPAAIQLIKKPVYP
jgi:hypothetical protein